MFVCLSGWLALVPVKSIDSHMLGDLHCPVQKFPDRQKLTNDPDGDDDRRSDS